MMGRVAIKRSLDKLRNSPPRISLNSKRVSLKSSEFRLQSGWLGNSHAEKDLLVLAGQALLRNAW